MHKTKEKQLHKDCITCTHAHLCVSERDREREGKMGKHVKPHHMGMASIDRNNIVSLLFSHLLFPSSPHCLYSSDAFRNLNRKNISNAFKNKTEKNKELSQLGEREKKDTHNKIDAIIRLSAILLNKETRKVIIEEFVRMQDPMPGLASS